MFQLSFCCAQVYAGDKHKSFGCAGITFQRKMTPTFSVVTAFLTYLDRRSFIDDRGTSVYGKANECERIWQFFRRPFGHFPIFHPNSIQNCKFRFSVQNAKFRDSVLFPSKTLLFSPYW